MWMTLAYVGSRSCAVYVHHQHSYVLCSILLPRIWASRRMREGPCFQVRGLRSFNLCVQRVFMRSKRMWQYLNREHRMSSGVVHDSHVGMCMCIGKVAQIRGKALVATEASKAVAQRCSGGLQRIGSN